MDNQLQARRFPDFLDCPAVPVAVQALLKIAAVRVYPVPVRRNKPRTDERLPALRALHNPEPAPAIEQFPRDAASEAQRFLKGPPGPVSPLDFGLNCEWFLSLPVNAV